MNASEIQRPSLIKPTAQTLFCIDFDWWKNNDSNWKIHLQSCLCEEHRLTFSALGNVGTIDWIDPETAEVRAVDALQHTLMSHCSHQPDFITSFTTIVDVVFRTLLANGNDALSPEQIGSKTGRKPDMILRTLTGPRVYKGIRPCSAIIK
jgi:hypothetical protein